MVGLPENLDLHPVFEILMRARQANEKIYIRFFLFARLYPQHVEARRYPEEEVGRVEGLKSAATSRSLGNRA